MSSSDIIGRWATLLLAEVLNLSASVAEKILFGQPRWLAQLRLLEANMRASTQTPAKASEDGIKGESDDLGPNSTRQMLESYAILNRTLKNIESRGLALDDTLVERMNCEWSPKSIVSYLLTCDTQLKHEIGEALHAAAKAIDPLPAAGRDHAKQQGQTLSRKTRCKSAAASMPKSSPKRRKDLAS